MIGPVFPSRSVAGRRVNLSGPSEQPVVLVLEGCNGQPTHFDVIRRISRSRVWRVHVSCYACGGMLAVWVYVLIISVYSLLHAGIGSNSMLLVCSGLVVY